MNVDRQAANHVLHLFTLGKEATEYVAPSQADAALYQAANILDGVDLQRLELVFPKHVAAVKLLKQDDGRDVLRAVAKAGVQ